MIRLNYTVIYPEVTRKWPDPSDPRREFRDYLEVVPLERGGTPVSEETLCDVIFAGMNGGSCQDFPWWEEAHVRSMSVGDVICFDNSDRFYICDSVGWLPVDKSQLDSWLSFPREYGCCSFELSKWKKTAGIKD
jgi:hypothetical protein